MWNEIRTQENISEFMKRFWGFHDSCIKEMRYLSGAYVKDDLAMLPINKKRILRVAIQRQFKEVSMLEIEFEGLKYLKLIPNDENYTCEILDSTLILKDGLFYWCDEELANKEEIENYKGTLICAAKMRWREIKDCMGDKEFYVSVK